MNKNSEPNKDLEFIRKILEWAINEANLDYLKELSSSLPSVINYREMKSEVSVEKLMDKFKKTADKKSPWSKRNNDE